ncbi:helix-turn-helix transcriptional regulator [Candidatus Solirubrobacter pratensis]|uniref:helix-turn-helix transcriptional regulator n=1 Tax=Candidatus Solirubrobacter pratensis TaxID=1298857 RepID=UPI00041B692B|nr:helix-turn-helix transcriptional regulator [Candidatus Solirubrobacter pratensis]
MRELVERDEELRALRAVVDRARGVVLIEGPPGVGISSLIEAGTAYAAARGLPVRTAADALAGGPMLLAVDDLQRIDARSLRSLAQIAAHADVRGVALILGLSTGEPPADAALVTRIAASAEVLEPARLSRDGVAAMLRVDPQDAEGIARATGGTPFLVAALAEGAEDRVGPWAAARLARLPPPARRLATTVATLGEIALRVAAPLAGLELHDAERAADLAAGAGLFAPGDPLRFIEPLTASAVAAPAAERERLHRRAAEALAIEGAPDLLIGRHLEHAPPAGDPAVAATLAAAAREEPEPAAAARLLERALAEPPPPDARATLLLELARNELAAGAPTAAARFEALLNTDRRADAWHGLAQAHLAYGRPRAAAEVAARGREDGAPAEPLLADELVAALFDPALQPVPDIEAPEDPSLCAVLAVRLAWRGAAVERIVPLACRSAGARPAALLTLVEALMAADEPALARELLDAADTRSDRIAEATVRSLRVYIGVFEGTFGDLGDGPPLLAPLARRTRLLIRRARGEDAGAPVSDEPLLRGTAAGLLLDGGRHAEAAEQYLAALAFDEDVMGIRHPGLAPWRSGAARALARLGEHERARELAAVEVERARAAAAPTALGRALSALALATGDLAGHEEAVALLERSPLFLPDALLELGTALSRAGRGREARAPLARALELSERLGLGLATPARDALREAGGRVRRRARHGAEALTSSERRVAQLAARGLTSREIAADLVLSPRTVEAHLRTVFRKLGIAARGELASVLRDET